MFGQEVDPLPRASDPQGGPGLLCVQQPLAALPVGALECIRVRPGRAFNRLYLNPGDRSLSDSSGQAFGFFFVHLRLFLRVEETMFAPWASHSREGQRHQWEGEKVPTSIASMSDTMVPLDTWEPLVSGVLSSALHLTICSIVSAAGEPLLHVASCDIVHA